MFIRARRARYRDGPFLRKAATQSEQAEKCLYSLFALVVIQLPPQAVQAWLAANHHETTLVLVPDALFTRANSIPANRASNATRPVWM